MKIIQLVDSLRVGGTERMSVNIANALTDATIENELVVSREGQILAKYLNKPDTASYLEKRSRFDISAFLKLNSLMKVAKPDVLHCHSSSIYWGVLLKILNPNIRLIFHDHYGFSENLKPNDRKLLRHISKWIDGVIAVNDQLMGWAQLNLKVKHEHIAQFNNFPYLPKVIAKKRAQRTIIHLANFRPQKDHGTLVRAVQLLTQQEKFADKNFEVLLVGDIDIDRAYTQSIVELITSLDLKDVIKVVGPLNDVARLLAEVHLGVLSSTSEGLPVSLLEYGLSGLPVVCTSVGQCAKVLKNGELGGLVVAGNALALASSIREALDNEGGRTEVKATHFKHYIESNFGSENFVNKYQSFVSAI
mgnify:CR=1 FL=1